MKKKIHFLNMYQVINNEKNKEGYWIHIVCFNFLASTLSITLFVANYNKYQDKDYCPIYAKESIKRVYEAYHNLGGNDVATKLYHTMLDMPEEPKDEQ